MLITDEHRLLSDLLCTSCIKETTTTPFKLHRHTYMLLDANATETVIEPVGASPVLRHVSTPLHIYICYEEVKISIMCALAHTRFTYKNKQSSY